MHQLDEYVFYSRFGGADHGVGEALPGQLAGERRSIEPVGGDQVVRLAERVAFADPRRMAGRQQQAVHVPAREGVERSVEPSDDPLRGVDAEDLPFVAELDTVAAARLVHVGRRDEHRDAFRLQLGEHVPEFVARHGIDPRRGFVEQQHRGTVDQRAAQRQLLFHAAREFPGAARAEGFDLSVDRGDQVAVGRGIDAEQRGEEVEVLLDREVGVEREPPGHVTHPPADFAVLPHDVAAIDRRRASVGVYQRREQAEQRGFARAVGTDQSEQLAPRDFECHAVERRQRAVMLGQTVRFYCVSCSRHLIFHF